MPKAYNPRDAYYRKAQAQGLRARSAFKLDDILQRFPQFLPKNAAVLDLGSAPGSFLQVLAKKAPRLLVGIDLNPIEPVEGTIFYQGDIFSEQTASYLRQYGQFDVIVSDMAPKTTGVPDNDQYHSVELCERVLELARDILKPNGNLLLKIFTGADFDPFWAEFKQSFKKAKVFKPDASRDRSRETFLVGESYLRELRITN